MRKIDKQIYKTRIRATIASQGAAYGFTLTVWGTGSLMSVVYGPFTISRISLFILGTLIMYTALVLLLYRPHETLEELQRLRPSAFAFLDFLSVPAGIGAGYLIFYSIPNPLIGIPLGSFIATLIYNLLLAAQVLVFMNRGPDE